MFIAVWTLSAAVSDAHPVSFTDGWGKVSDVIDLKLNVFLDDVLRFSDCLTEGQHLVDRDVVLNAIENHTDLLTKELRVFDRAGRPLSIEIRELPKWRPRSETTDLNSDASLKISWTLLIGNDDKGQSDLSALTFLHGYTHPSLPTVGELRLHLQNGETGRRSDAVVAPGRPFTLIVNPSPTTGGVVESATPNILKTRLVLSPSGPCIEILAPLALCDHVWPGLRKFRATSSDSGDDSATARLSHEQLRSFKAALVKWAADNIGLFINHKVATPIGERVSLLDSEAQVLVDGSSESIPVYGTLVGVQARFFVPADRISGAEVRLKNLPGSFDEMQVELVGRDSSIGRTMFPLEPVDAGRIDIPWTQIELHSVVSRFEPAQVEESEFAGQVPDPVRINNRYPGRWGIIGFGLAIGVAWFGKRFLLVKGTAWPVQAAISCLGLAALCVFPDRNFHLREDTAVPMFQKLLTKVYRATAHNDQMSALLDLSSVLSDDLAERTYLATLELYSADADNGLLVDVDQLHVRHVSEVAEQTARDRIVADVEWQLSGAVFHWGHVHPRQMQFSGRVSLQSIENRWRIVDFQTTDFSFERADNSAAVDRI
ncbi:MAG: hypothetical protein KDA81_00010 [Planctomycetaceae bacterium]|nr:hypothetical protein [Planctomycetaceae bacterium]